MGGSGHQPRRSRSRRDDRGSGKVPPRQDDKDRKADNQKQWGEKSWDSQKSWGEKSWGGANGQKWNSADGQKWNSTDGQKWNSTDKPSAKGDSKGKKGPE